MAEEDFFITIFGPFVNISLTLTLLGATMPTLMRRNSQVFVIFAPSLF